jgi:titin
LVPPNSTSFSDTSPSGSTGYTYQVRAVSSEGASTWSNQAGATTWPPPPAPPTGLAAVAVSSAQINLTWTVPNSNQTAVSVWRRSCSGPYTRIAVLAPTASGYADTGLSPATAYVYRVRTANSYYPSTWTGEVIATTGL